MSSSFPKKSPFCLGIPGWCPCYVDATLSDLSGRVSLRGYENQPEVANQKSKDCYAFSTSQDVEQYHKGYCPWNSTRWSMITLSNGGWPVTVHKQTRTVPPIFFSQICLLLTTGCRREDGSQYPPWTLYSLLSWLQRHVHATKQNSILTQGTLWAADFQWLSL